MKQAVAAHFVYILFRLQYTMNSVGSNCNELKQEYDACFNVWFSTRFLKGNHSEEMCAPLFKLYTQCVKEAIKEQKIDMKEIEKNVLNTEEEQKKPTGHS